MKTLMALVLSLGMVLLGTAPVMAAGQLMAPKAPVNFSAPVKILKPDPSLTQPAIPEPPGFRTMSDEELEQIEGEFGPLAYIAARGLIGAVVGAVAGAVKSYVDTGHVNAKTVAAGAALGMLSGLAGGASALIPKP